MPPIEVPDVWDDLYALELTEDDGRSPEVGPSDAGALVPGRGCRRQLAYRVQRTPPTDPVPDHVRRAAAIGHAIHERVARARARRASDYWTAIETPVALPGFHRDGTVDAYSFVGARVDDVKSVSRRVFDTVVEAGRAREDHVKQVEVYGCAMEESGWSVIILSVTYICRDDGRTFADSWTFNRSLAQATYNDLSGLASEVRWRDPLEYGRAAQSPGRAPCDSCAFRSRCWGDAATNERTPRVINAPEAVAELARRYVQMAETRRTIDDHLSDMRDTLLRSAGMEFTDNEGARRTIRVTQGRLPGDGGQLDQRAARARLEYWGEDVPTLGTAPRLSFPAITDGGRK